MKTHEMYKYCVTYKKQCSKAKRNGYCSRAEHEKCVALNRDIELAMKMQSYSKY